MKVYPTEFTCQGGQPQKVRFTITGVKSLPSGESKLMLFLEDTNTKELAIRRANGTIGGTIVVKTRVGVPIFLDKGNYTKHGTLDTVVMKKIGEEYGCEYKVSSTGNSKIRYTGVGYLSQGDKLVKQFQIYGAAVEGGTYLEKLQHLDLANDELNTGQEYKIKFVLTYQDEHNKERILKKEITFKPLKQDEKNI